MFDFGIHTEWYWKNIVARGLLSVVPGSWFGFADQASLHVGDDHHMVFSDIAMQSFQTLASPSAWIGVVAGVAMIYAATRIRRWKDEG